MAKNNKNNKNDNKFASKKSIKIVGPKYVELKGFLSFFILHELKKNDLSGDELAKRIGERRGASLTPGTIYPALKRLRRQKLIQYKKDGRKKVYSLTILGSKELKGLYGLFEDLFYGLKSRLK